MSEVSVKDRIADLIGWYGAFGANLTRAELRNRLVALCRQAIKENVRRSGD